MSTILKALSGMLYSGATLPLASAPFKNELNAMYGFNPAGTGYTVFKPGSNFNSLKELVQDGSYIVDAKSPGFELPGAVLTAVPAAGGTAQVVDAVASRYENFPDFYNISFGLEAHGVADTSFRYFITHTEYGSVVGNGTVEVGGVGEYTAQISYFGQHTISVMNNSGVAAVGFVTIVDPSAA